MDAAALTLPFLFALIAVALAFDFLNGMNDAANSIATIVSTRVLRPQYAVAWAAFFNFIAFLFFGLHVAETVGRGIVEADVVNSRVIFGALAGAIVWQIFTQRLGIPSSSSHALIGGLVGAGLAKAGVQRRGLVRRRQDRCRHLFCRPGSACCSPLLLMLMVSWIFVRSDAVWRRQYFSPRAIRVGVVLCARPWRQRCAEDHGHHRRAALFARASSAAKFYVPFWVVIACQIAMALGTLAGGWRIVKTMGSKITRLTPMQGVCAETAGSVMLFAATSLGIPVSTTHTITGSIIGVGAAKKVSAVRWAVAKEIVTAWIITIPASGLLAALFYWLSGLFG